MNKPIIIDGVDVSECDCYDHTYCLWSKKYHEIRITPACEIVKDCYFKQLQRLKAENDGLKSQLDFEIQKRETVEAEIEKLKQAFEDVREIANLCLGRSDCIMCPNYDKCEIEDAEIPTHDVCKPIISQINEVLKDE